MPLPVPNLDDRTFQDLVDEAKRMIPRICPEWTDHNVSDPGVTLIELFAWMVDMLLFRLNRVPEKSQITFLELMGVRLEPAHPAAADLTVWLSAPAEVSVLIPAGTQVSTAQTPTDPAVTFTTDRDLAIEPLGLAALLTSPNERVFDDQTWKLTAPEQSFAVFSPRPRPGDAFYTGLASDPSASVLGLFIEAALEGIGVDPRNPPLVWEAWGANGWITLDDAALARDDTNGLNRPGLVVLFMPPGMVQQTISEHTAWWLRCVYVAPEPGQSAYSASPVISSVQPQVLGGTVRATHCTAVPGAILGRSDGAPGQRFSLEYLPVLSRRADEFVEAQRPDGSWEPWIEQADFSRSGPQDRHYTLDSVSGEVAFGPAIREPSGVTRQYGAIAEREELLRMTRYRTGGGALGNVGAGTIRIVQTAVPYVDRVINRQPARGGRDAESLEHAAVRAPQLLRTRFRAVTAEDYEYLAVEASPGVARAHCVQPGAFDPEDADAPQPGTVRVLLVPYVTSVPATPDGLRVAPQVLGEVSTFLDERRLLTTRLEITEPQYTWVAIEARLNVFGHMAAEAVQQAASAVLQRHIDPVRGGDGSGWPFGRALYVAELYGLLQAIPGVKYVEDVVLRPASGENREPVPMIDPGPHGLLGILAPQVTVRV